MDWKAIKDKAAMLKTRGIELGRKALPYVEKVADFTEEQFESTPLVLKDKRTYDEEVKKYKKYLVVAVDKNDPSYKKIMLHYPSFAAKSWTMSAALRLMDTAHDPNLTASLSISNIPMLLVHYEGVEFKKYIGVEAIIGWFETPCFYDEVTPTEPTTVPQNDPLLSKN